MSSAQTFPNAPLPTPKQVKARTSVLRQGWRFAVLNMKMLTMVTKGHH
jgi:hypothetical protein